MERAEKLKQIIIENVGVELDASEIQADTELLTLGVNSISFIKIVVAIEAEFGFEFMDDELNFESDEFRTFGAFVEFIQSKEEANC